MDIENTQRLLEILKKLEEAFRRHNLPGKDQSALRAIQQLCIELKGENDYVTEKASRIATLAGIYYSARYERHPGGEKDLMSEMSHQLPGVIRSQISYLERRQRDAEI